MSSSQTWRGTEPSSFSQLLFFFKPKWILVVCCFIIVAFIAKQTFTPLCLLYTSIFKPWDKSNWKTVFYESPRTSFPYSHKWLRTWASRDRKIIYDPIHMDGMVLLQTPLTFKRNRPINACIWEESTLETTQAWPLSSRLTYLTSCLKMLALERPPLWWSCPPGQRALLSCSSGVRPAVLSGRETKQGPCLIISDPPKLRPFHQKLYNELFNKKILKCHSQFSLHNSVSRRHPLWTRAAKTKLQFPCSTSSLSEQSFTKEPKWLFQYLNLWLQLTLLPLFPGTHST